MLSSLDPTSRTILVLIVIVGLYALSGLIWPYTRCPACDAGKHHSPAERTTACAGNAAAPGEKPA